MKRCYNCGIPFTELNRKQRTKEHIPAKTFFNGYPENYKNQRITVPACEKCNGEYSRIDDQLRDLIGISNECDEQKVELTSASVRKILSNKKELNDRLSIEEDTIWITFDLKIIDELHKKNFKGLYNDLTKQPLPTSYSIDVYSIGQDQKKLLLAQKFIDELSKLNSWKKSGNENVFRFKMASVELNASRVIDFNVLQKEPEILICAMEYNSAIIALVIAMKQGMESYY